MNKCQCHHSHHCRIVLPPSVAGNMAHFIAICHYWTRYWTGQSERHKITESVWSSFCGSF